MDVVSIILTFIGGLVLFLHGVTLLSEALSEVAGDRARSILARFTTNRLAGVATGLAATALLDSSSATIIMVIAMVHAGLLTFPQSLAVILGSNIGTTVSTQLFALDVERYAPIALLVGFLLRVLLSRRAPRVAQAGRVLFASGLVFFALGVIADAVTPLQESEAFDHWMRQVESPWIGAAAGAVGTIVIQSSSALMGIVITLGDKGLIELSAAIALMLGAEVGTCADTLVASVGRSRAAIRAGVFHTAFNLLATVVGILLVHPFIDLVSAISENAPLERTIANAHVLFNVVGVAVMLFFVRSAARLLERVIPDPSQAARPSE